MAPFLVDAVLVIVFCVIGRRSHDEAALTGLLRTLWPFATGLLLGWAVALWLRRNTILDGRALWPTGVTAWLGTLIGGQLLRVLSGQGTAVSFVLVATTVLAIFLLGWRALLHLVPHSRLLVRSRQ